MEQKFIKFFEKVNQIRKETIDLDGSPKEKMDYLINKIMLYIYDGDAEYVDVLLFDTLDEINKYYKDYVKGE